MPVGHDKKKGGNMIEIDPKLLDGLKFRYSEENVIVENGRKVRKYLSKERPLTPEDVLSMKDYGDSIVIVTADGQKIALKKKATRKEK